ncbi:hypothetical protein ABXN37_17255 [Piscinibacter sakaiensis]|uniref:hypothetical protein n=1 Tax=Piscinibacter sakaiensis TaxID=1547922 RepID=UPI003727220C
MAAAAWTPPRGSPGPSSAAPARAGRLPGCDGGAVALVARHWPARDRIRVEANVGSMLYDPVQGTTSPAGRLQVLDSRGQGITHVVNLSGRLRSCSPQAAVPGYRSC